VEANWYKARKIAIGFGSGKIVEKSWPRFENEKIGDDRKSERLKEEEK
jgi:hypothetical protein